MPILRAVNLSKSFLGLQALHDFTVEVQRGEILGLDRAERGGQDYLL